MVNLLSNALKFSNKGSEIKVNLETLQKFDFCNKKEKIEYSARYDNRGEEIFE